MALSDYLKRGQIGPSLKGQHYQYERNGRWVTAKWPKKRGPARSQKQKNAEIAFAEACFAMKRTASEIQMFHRENAKGTPMLPRDSLMAALYGNGPAIHFYNGKVIKPMANKYLASTVLDAIGWQPGMLLYRGPDTWEVVPPGGDGQVLAYSAELKRPQWEARSDGGAAKKAVYGAYETFPGGTQNVRGNAYMFAEALTLETVGFWGDYSSGDQVGLVIAFLGDDNVVDANIHDFGFVYTAPGGVRYAEIPLPYAITIPAYERFAVATYRSKSSGAVANRTYQSSYYTSTVRAARRVFSFSQAIPAIVPGILLSATGSPIVAIDLEFK